MDESFRRTNDSIFFGCHAKSEVFPSERRFRAFILKSPHRLLKRAANCPAGTRPGIVPVLRAQQDIGVHAHDLSETLEG
jgi:hypothetical protein